MTLLIVAALPRTAAAQSLLQGVRVGAHAGWYEPSAELARLTGAGASRDRVYMQAGAVAGITAAVPFMDERVSIGLSTSRTINTDLRARFASFTEEGEVISRVPVRVADAAISALVIEARVSPFQGMIRPYAHAGAGVRRYEFSRRELDVFYADSILRDETRAVVQYGVGVIMNLRRADLFVEARALRSSFPSLPVDGSASGDREDRTQHDRSITAGFRWKLGQVEPRN